MFNQQDLPEPDKSTQEQPVDWEARFKGLQREFNKLKTSSDAREGLAKDLQTRITELETQLADGTKSLQGDLVKLQSDLDLATTKLTKAEARAAEAEAKATAEARKAAVQAEIVTGFPEHSAALTTAIEKGFLQIGERQGDDLKTFLNDYLAFTNQKVTQAVAQTVRGASPPALSQGEQGSLDEGKLADWLMTHDETDPNYEANYRAWLHPTAN